MRIQGYLRGEGKSFPQLAKCGGNEFLGRFFVFHLQPLYFFGGFCRKMADDAFCQYSGTLENDALRRMRVHFFWPGISQAAAGVCHHTVGQLCVLRIYDAVLSKHGLAGHDVSVPSFSAVAAAFGKNRIPGAVCIFSGGNDRCQFLSGVYAGFVPDLGSWYLDLIFFAAGDPAAKGRFSWLPGLWGRLCFLR